MARKNKKKSRKRKRLTADSKRQAHASIKGYHYQILHSVEAWLGLAEAEILYLEGAEDFDKISGDAATTTQVKHTQGNITLRSQEVIDAINNFWKLRTDNPGHSVKFRLLTRSKVVKEKGDPIGMNKPGLEIWSRCSDNEAAITKISEFLQSEGKISAEVTNFIKKASPQEIYEQLIEPIAWETNSKPISYVEQSIREHLIHHGDRYSISPPDAEKVVAPLITEAWRAASDEKNRELTRSRLLEIFAENTRVSVPIQDTQGQQTINLKALLDSIKEAFLGDSPDINIAIQSKFHIQNTVPRLLPDAISREELLTSIQTKLQSEGIAIIQGGTGKGKTTLANLTTKSINGDWSWLNFTNKDPSRVVQFLQQLSVAVSGQSAQVNVVLDDLNLQPQQLRTYEEILGIVIYRVRERGAKLLITSQYNPPNNLSRNLGLSSLVVHVRNFTILEIEQFATKMGCPAEDAKDLAELFQVPTKRHPRLVHALFTQLREKDWKQQDVIESIFQSTSTITKELEDARQLLADLPENQREFLYRLSLMVTEFRKECALNIGKIPEPIPHPGLIFTQLVGPWIDQVSENYYTISPLLTNAAKEDLSDESKIKDLHAQIANAIRKTKNLTTTEAWAVFTHSVAGQNKEGIIAFIYSLMNASQSDWKNLCQEFSLLAHIKIDSQGELFPGDAFINQMFRSLQYRIAVEIKPELVPKIFEIWDKETKPYEPYQSYLLSRLMLATEILRYNQVLLPAKKMVGYLKEMVNIKDSDKEVWTIFYNSMGQLEGYKTDKSNYFSILFGFIYARRPMYASFLSDLIDALDELESETRTLLLADFEDDTVDSRVLIDGIWGSEANLENPDWVGCLRVFDKVIEKTIAWNYPHFAAAAARGKATIYDECLDQPDTAHKILQDFVSDVGSSPVIEETQAVIYLHQKRYKEALDIYERILPEWNPPSGQLDVMPPEGCRRAAMCAAHLDDWKKAATFFQDGAKRNHKTMNAERYVGFYADAGFAHFKAGNMLNCIKFLHLALKNFETLPQDNTEVKYFTLKKRLEHTIKWIKTIWCEWEDNSSELFEPAVGFCSDPETNEKVLDLPDSPIGYSWFFLAQIEYRFGHETTVFQHALQTTDREEYPTLNFFLSFLEAQYDFRNKTFNNLPQRIYQLALIFSSMKKHQQSGRGVAEKGSYSISDSDLSDFASVENITIFFISALLTQLLTNRDLHEILSVWRTSSLELPIKENIFIALDLIESMLFGDYNQALTVMKTENTKGEKQLTASLKVVINKETSLENLFYAHTFIASSLFDHTWLDPVAIDFGKLLSLQWLKKIKSEEMSLMNTNMIQQIEQACNSSEAGKQKIGRILLAVYPIVTTMIAPQTLQKFRTWTESPSKQKQEPATRKNPTAQRLIKAMEKPPHLTDEDIEALNQSIKEGEIPIKFDSPFDSDESNK